MTVTFPIIKSQEKLKSKVTLIRKKKQFEQHKTKVLRTKFDFFFQCVVSDIIVLYVNFIFK